MIKIQNYYGWNGFQLNVDDVELGIVPDIGGRIISLKFKGKELFYVDFAIAGKNIDLSHMTDLALKKRELGFLLWGGDKTWVAPQHEWIELSPPLDLDAAPYSIELEKNAVTMTSPLCRETGLRLIRRVELKNNNVIILEQTLINESDKSKQCAIWDVTQLLKPFEIQLPCFVDSIHHDPRFEAGKTLRDQLVQKIDDAWSKIICKNPVIYKYGSLINQGKVIAIQDHMCMTRTFDIFPDEKYPDDHMIEVYNSPDRNYLELEILAPLKTLKPGEKTMHRQVWEIKGAHKGEPLLFNDLNFAIFWQKI